MARYTPPPQSKIGQVIDVIVLLILYIKFLDEARANRRG